MKRLTITALTSAFIAASVVTTAQAQQPMVMQPYVGGDAMFWESNPDSGNSRDSVGVRLNGGVQFNDYFAVEGQLGTGGSDGPVELESLAGIYAKGILPISQDFRIFGLLGGTEVDFDSADDSDVSYGAGAEFDVAPNLAVGADYMRYLDTSEGSFDAASLGVRYRF